MGMYAGGPESIRDGGLTASWELYPAKLGEVAGAAAVALARGDPTEKVIHTEMTFVTKDNIGDFLK
jgi:ABC-type sugar transport system substrate-binding protein